MKLLDGQASCEEKHMDTAVASNMDSVAAMRKAFRSRNKTNEREQKHYGVAFAGYNEAFSEGEWLDINTKEVLCLVTIDKVFFFQMFYLCLDT